MNSSDLCKAFAKLRTRIDRNLIVLEDCVSRTADGLDGVDPELPEFAYVNRQLSFARERVQIIEGLLRQFTDEYVRAPELRS